MSAERFVEEIGLVFDSMHLPRMAGRVLGAILLGPADGPTAAELAETLQASKGSISNMTQLLIHYRFIERTVRAGDRRDRFVIKSGAWARMMLWRLELLATTAGARRRRPRTARARKAIPNRCRRFATCTHSWNVSCPSSSIDGRLNARRFGRRPPDDGRDRDSQADQVVWPLTWRNRRGSRRRSGPDLRVPGPQRRRQVDHDPPAARPHPADERIGRRAGAGRSSRSPRHRPASRLRSRRAFAL